MAAIVAGNGTFQPYEDSSQPPTQTSSPNSPTFSLHNQSRSVNGTSSLEAPPDMPFPEYLRTWDDSTVARWLSDIRCGHLANTFSANDIRGDVLLELDQLTLKEMGMSSVGDRLRVLNGVKSLRQRCSSTNAALVSIMNRPRISEPGRSNSLNGDIGSFPGRGHRRLESGRPAPLHLTPSGGSPDPNLPRIIRDGVDSSGSTQPMSSSTSARYMNGIRPLPQQPGSGSSTHSTPTTTHSVRSNLPPLPPPPRGQPPLPPNPRTPHSLQPPPSGLSGRRTPIPSDSSPYSPHTNNNLLTPTSGSQGVRTPLRSQSPQLPFPSMVQSTRASAQNNAHIRSGSLNNPPPAPPVKLPPRPSTGSSSHPYAQNGPQATLSPIAESFIQRSNRNGISGPVQRPNTPQNNSAYAPSLDDLRRKLVKFALPSEGKSATINVADCAGGVEVLIKALKKFNKLSSRGEVDGSERVETEDGGLSVEGWGVFLNGGDEPSGKP